MEFPDGDFHTFDNIFGLAAKTRSVGKKPVEVLWQAEHKRTHNIISIKQRTDRHLLISIFNTDNQICQARMDAFGELPQPQPAVVPIDHPTLAKALKHLSPVFQKFADDVFKNKYVLQKARDLMMKKHNFETPEPQVFQNSHFSVLRLCVLAFRRSSVVAL